MFKIFRYLTKKERYGCALVLLLIWAQVWLDLKMPDYMANITMLVETPGSALADILQAGGGMLACAFCSMLAFLGASYLTAHIATGFSRTLRRAVYEKTMSFSLAELQRFSTASLSNRTTNDITRVQQLESAGLQAMLTAPLPRQQWRYSLSCWSWPLSCSLLCQGSGVYRNSRIR